MLNPDFFSNLNQEQLEAAAFKDGPAVCIAGAGTGKTRTIVYRAAKLISEGIPPERILLLTFTRKAANNMSERAKQLADSVQGSIRSGTFHSFATYVLKKFYLEAGLKRSFTIIDTSDSKQILGSLRKNYFKNNTYNSKPPTNSTLQKLFSACAAQKLSLKELINTEHTHFEPFLKEILQIKDDYKSYKSENSLLDYDDLLLKTVELFSNDERVLQLISSEQDYIMVDEYQDTNFLQAEMLRLLGHFNHNIMVVGDDSQSIYAFRGAEFKNLSDFPNLFKEAKTFRLTQNYRSTQNILNASNHLISKASEGFKNKLETENPEGSKIAIVPCMNEEQESLFICKRITDFLKSGIKPKEIAVLFRAGYHAFRLEMMLKTINLPFVKWGGFKFLESVHLKDIISYLRIINNPWDKLGWLRVLMDIKGIGLKRATDISEELARSEEPFDFSNIPENFINTELSLLQQTMLQISSQSFTQPSLILNAITDYYLKNVMKKKFDNYTERLKDIDALAAISLSFGSLDDFLTSIILEPPENMQNLNLASQNEQSEDSITLSTVHSAKGMEWEAVFIISAVQGRFPNFKALKNKEEMEEERRLFYVAMTRAKKHLTITLPQEVSDFAANISTSQPSQFISELYCDSCETWKLLP